MNRLIKNIDLTQNIRYKFLFFFLAVILISGFLLSFLIGRFDAERKLSNEKIKIISEITTLRANLIGEVNSTFNLTQGLTHLISYQGDISQDLFNAMSKQAIKENHHIRNIALAPNNTIRWVYPHKGNERAVGLNYYSNAEQWPSISRAMESKTPILAGPVNLVQGGKGFIYRSPIFIANSTTTSEKTYWGVASIVAYVDSILINGGIASSKNLNILLQGKDGLGEFGETIWGDENIISLSPVSVDVFIPGGKWVLMAIPTKGWPNSRFYNSNYFILSLFFTILIGGLLLVLIIKNQDIRLKNLELAHEINERKRIEEELVRSKEAAEAANRMKTVFLANMSHEIRTPMNAILGFSDLMLKRNVNEKDSNRYLEIINSSTRQLLNVINDIIDISIIETGQLKIHISPVNINMLITNSFDLNIGSAKTKKIELNFVSKLPNHLATIYIDEFRLNQILNNLINNAIKYTNQGRIHVGYTLKNKLLEFFVRDTGIGISKEHHQEIFEIFRQVDEMESNKYGGTGLGLAITKSLVERMGGRIWVDSELNVGSTFYFTLPYNQVKVNESVSIRNFDSNIPLLQNKKILIAEDDEASYILLDSHLKYTQANVTWIKDGNDVLDAIITKNYDLLLLDIKLPNKNGLEIVKEIRKMSLKIPIIAQTAFAMNDDKEIAIEAGCDYYISKPIDQFFLFELLRLIFNEE